MKSKYRKDIVKFMADKIRSELLNSTMFGEPIDMEDIDFLLVAAKELGKAEGYKELGHGYYEPTDINDPLR